MRSILLSIVFTLTAAATANAQMQTNNPCMMVGALQLPQQGIVSQNPLLHPVMAIDNNNILLGLGITAERRLKVVCELRDTILQKYSLITLKKERLNIDVDQHMQDCARDELSITSTDRQEFMDRVIKCIAGIQDTHFGANPRVPRPVVMAPIVVAPIAGKIIITRQSPSLIARAQVSDPDGLATLADDLAPGNEITMIDGKPASDAIAELVPYVNASSPAYAEYIAALTYFGRDLKYPTKKTVDVEVRTESGDLKHYTLPWFAQYTPGHYDAQMKLKALGLPTVNSLQWKYNPVLRKMEKQDSAIATVGFSVKNPMFPDSAMTQYNDDDGAPGLRVAQVVQDSQHVFCYMQLLTFESDKLTKAGTDNHEDFMAPMQKFIASCEAKKLPLIFDLKANGGGHGNYPAKLLAILTEKGAKYGPDVAAFPVTESSIDLLTMDIKPGDTGAATLDNGATMATAMASISDALQSGQKQTDVLNSGNVVADPKVGGYSQKIVAVVTPHCISACDMMSRLLKNSHRATLVGTSANGTGAGYNSQPDLKVDSTFADSEGLFSFQIPNFMFGVETKADDAARLPWEQYKGLMMENMPTMADVQAPLTVNDVRSGYSADLADAAVAELFK